MKNLSEYANMLPMKLTHVPCHWGKLLVHGGQSQMYLVRGNNLQNSEPQHGGHSLEAVPALTRHFLYQINVTVVTSQWLQIDTSLNRKPRHLIRVFDPMLPTRTCSGRGNQLLKLAGCPD